MRRRRRLPFSCTGHVHLTHLHLTPATGARHSVMSGFFTGLLKRYQASYRAEVGKNLASRGLLYEDVLVETSSVKLALSRLPKDVLNAREQRLKRAMVLSSQQRYLPEDVAAKIDPFEKYLQPYIEAIEAEEAEMAKLAK